MLKHQHFIRYYLFSLAKLFSLTALFFSLSLKLSSAEYSEHFFLRGVTGQYQDARGRASLDEVRLSGSGFSVGSRDMDIGLLKNNASLNLSWKETSLALGPRVAASFENFSSIRIENADLGVERKSLQWTGDRVELEMNAQRLSLDKSRWSCEKRSRFAGEHRGLLAWKRLLRVCFQQSHLSLETLSLENNRPEPHSIRLENFFLPMSESIQGFSTNSSTMNRTLSELSDIDFFVGDKNFKLNVKVFSFIKAEIKGKVFDLLDQNAIAFRVDKAGIGLIPIRNRFWRELEKVRSEHIVLRRPYIYVLFEPGSFDPLIIPTQL
jgi:hypothetical protein